MRAVETADAEVHDAGGENSRSHATASVRVTVPVMFYERKFVRVASSGACVCAGWPCDIRVFFFRGASFTRFVGQSKSLCVKLFETFLRSDWLAA